MRQKTVLLTLFVFAALSLAADHAGAQAFVATDWIRHRASLGREGSNAGDIYPDPADPTKVSPAPKGRVWIWPPPADMPAEMAVDDLYPAVAPDPLVAMFPAGGAWSLGATPRDTHNFGLAGTWNTAPIGSDRTFGAWPPVDVDTTVNPQGVLDANRQGDYYWADAVFNQQLSRLANLDLQPGVPGNEGLDRLRMMPNMDSFDAEPQLANRNFYNVVDQELRNNTTFARWSFGRIYPQGTAQGTLDVTGQPLQANQRYAIYIRYPSSGTVINGIPRPNSDWVFVRVSWGDNPDDPRLSRIFMLNFGDNGGFWKRIQSGGKEDRYFPYDGVHPLTVTLYTATFTTPNEIGVPTIVPADAVRLVPEAARGDINAPAASAVFPPGANPRLDPNAVKLTYFGRDETMGPKPIFEPANIAQTTPVGNFLGIPYNPTLPPQQDSTQPNYNPLIADPSSSIRSAVFYCFEDYIAGPTIANHRYGKLRWRYVSRTTPVRSQTIDDEPLPVPTAGGFNQVGFTAQTDAAGNAQAYGGDPVVPTPATYHTAPTVNPAPATATASWTTTLTSRVTGGTYSVWVWIPAPDVAVAPNGYAHRAHYQIDTDAGVMDVLLDQRNTDPTVPPAQVTRIGQWRRLATGVRFPGTVVNGVETVTAVVRLGNDASALDVTAGRMVVADAIQFVAESQSRNSVVSSPLISRVTWPSGVIRNVVYFGTTDGHLWCLDALGPDQTAAGAPTFAGGFPAHTGTLTSAYWVYPSITNPEPGVFDPVANPLGEFRDVRDDPNVMPDALNNRQSQGIDGDVETVNIGGQQVHRINEASRVPDLGAFVSSPLLVDIPSGAATQPMIVVGNSNGRVYGFSPHGRTVTVVDAQNPVVGEPFNATFARHLNQGVGAPPEAAGIPGTTRRVLTWPTLRRDRWLRANSPGFPNNVENEIKKFNEDAAKQAFTASLAAELQATNVSAWVVAGAGDGHVYAVQLQGVQFNERISNSDATPGSTTDGRARWQFPNDKKQLGAITQTGTLTFNGQANSQYIFSAPDTNQGGFRVYAIDIPTTNTGATANINWIYPHTTSPGGNPANTDLPPVETAFTAPAWLPTLRPGFNGGREVVFVANTDGRVHALDASIRTNLPPVLLWQDNDPLNPLNMIPSPSRTLGTTHASTTFLNKLRPLNRFITRFIGVDDPDPTTRGSTPALLLPLDTGDIVAFNALTGRFTWIMPDGAIGGVPVNVPNPLPAPVGPLAVPFTTSNVWRGADIITTDKWMYQGDQGNQDLGESNGQMRAYADSALFGINSTPNAPAPDGDWAAVDIRIVDVFNGLNDSPPGPWDNFLPPPFTAPAISPFHAVTAGAGGGPKANTQGNVLVYEWGDDIKVAAWGAFYYNPADPNFPSVPPRVSFRLNTGRQTPPVTVQAVIDTAYALNGGPALVIDTAVGDPIPPTAWVAKTVIPLARGSAVNAQTPGTRYQIDVVAEVRSGSGRQAQWGPLSAGQVQLQPFDWDPAGFNRSAENPPGPPRLMSIAHPFAVTTRGFDQTGIPMSGASFLNILGWTNDQQPDNLTGDLSEILANGNLRWNIATWAQDPTNPVKDLVAPVGMGNHGNTVAYAGIDDRIGSSSFGKKVPALFIADRSNVYKRNQPLQVRVDRTDLRWGWNPNNTAQQYTGNVMNPLPWEQFPNTLPNVSQDYPNMEPSRGTFRGNGIDMSIRGVTLPLPDRTTSPGRKRLSPLPIDMEVSVPQYQPANVNTDFFDLRGAINPGYMASNGLLGPLGLNTGRDVANNATLVGNVSPSAGYVSQYYVFVDTNQNSRLEAAGAPGATQQTILTGQEEVYRQVTVGLTVPPDLKARVEEETIDLGKLPHSTGYSPFLPYGPSGIGPYGILPAAPDARSISPWTIPNAPQFFMPFTVRNNGNVNLINMRAAKVVGRQPADVTNPTFWARLTSDQVEPNTGVGQIWGMPFFPSAQNDGRGSIGFVTSLDHGHSDAAVPQFEIDYTTRWGRPNFWPMQNPYVPTLALGHPLLAQGWAAGVQPRPTLHKPRVGDPGPTSLSVPDVQHGDVGGLLAQTSAGSPATGIGREVRPMIGLGIPLGTPAGTYGAPVQIFEDAIPDQWWSQSAVGPFGWVNRYSQITGQPSQLRFARDDDGMLNILQSGQPIESVSDPALRLKVTVREARITNSPSVPIANTPVNPNTYLQPTGDYPHVDVRLNNPPFGANIQPAAIMDRTNRSINMFWASPRANNFAPFVGSTTTDMPWYLNFSQLFQDQPSLSGLDWLFEPLSGNRLSWWKRLPTDTQYPAAPYVASARNLFPSEAADLPAGRNLPLVPGQISAATERHATPAMTQDQVNPNAPIYVFWQGAVYKSATGAVPAGANQGFTMDSRTFYAPLLNGVPNPPNGVPFSFLNDPNQPKYAPKPLVLTTVNGVIRGYLFWVGGERGRSRLFFNRSNDLADPLSWTRDEALSTPGGVQGVADPVPIHRRIVRPNGTLIDVIDVVYTGTLGYRSQAESVMTRYLIENDGDLEVEPMPRAIGEMLVREGATQTWVSRDIAWVYRDPTTRNLTDPAGRPPYTLFLLRGTNAPLVLTTGTPTFDRATGHVNWRSALGGNLAVDPQSGRVIFSGASPLRTDRIMLNYTPQSARLNATRNESGGVTWNDTYPPSPALPAAWLNDTGFTPKPHANSPGSNAGPSSFIDRSINPRALSDADANSIQPFVMLPGVGSNPATVSRLWLFYRKSNANVTAPAAIYFKTMRLMVRLPRGVLLNNPNARRDARPNVTIANNRGPVEIDWARGRLYFTEVDEGNDVSVTFNSPSSPGALGPFVFRVAWGDEITTAIAPGDQVTTETVLPTDSAVNEGQITAFKDLFADRVWVFWSSTRTGTTDLYYMPISPQFYPLPAPQ